MSEVVEGSWGGHVEGSINLITATGSVPLENYLTTVGNVGSKFASAQFADDDCISFPSVIVWLNR